MLGFNTDAFGHRYSQIARMPDRRNDFAATKSHHYVILALDVVAFLVFLEDLLGFLVLFV